MESGRERDNKMEILNKWSWEMFALLHHLLHSTCVSEWVWLGVHSPQNQLAMSCNQGRKVPPATGFWWLTLPLSPSSRFAVWPTTIWRFIFCLFGGEFRRIQSADGLTVLGSISDCGCRFGKVSFCPPCNPKQSTRTGGQWEDAEALVVCVVLSNY